MSLTAQQTHPGQGSPPWAPSTWRQLPAPFWLLLSALLLNIFSGRWGDMGIPLGPDRLLFAAAFLLILLDPRIPRPRARLLHAAMLLFTAWAAASMILHGPIGIESVYTVLDRVAMPFLLFACAPMFFRSALQRIILLRSLTLLGVYLGCTAILETLGVNSLLLPRYIAAFKSSAGAIASGNAARAGGPFISGEANGMALALCAVAALLLARLDARGWRVLGLLTGMLCLLTSVLSLTRSVWLGVLMAVFAVALSRRRLLRWLPALAVAGLLLAAAGALAMPDVAANIVERGTTSRSLNDRQNSNVAALRALNAHPLTGVGWAQFVKVGPDWVRQADDYPVTTVNIEVHNVVLSRTAELGLPAGALFVGILAFGPFGAALRRRSDPTEDDWRVSALAALMIWFVPAMTSPIPYPFPTFVFFTLMGLVWAWPQEHDPLTYRKA
ncbi:O-antigen ligase family protein [Gephyromycinifex aptenodytis]|uniref:O-antigen ligase family protein n=1 Tax=Gephyromycinifex aptenodytis TaxID=2716227 RepID=UPI0014458E7F|nr:O-antigen ligase family protein [Gephyromycinifex aptenodytis]